MSVDDVIKSGLLNVIGLFSRDVIGWKTRVEFVQTIYFNNPVWPPTQTVSTCSQTGGKSACSYHIFNYQKNTFRLYWVKAQNHANRSIKRQDFRITTYFILHTMVKDNNGENNKLHSGLNALY